jgi:hypothetical protein
MAAVTGNGPQATHRGPLTPCRRVGLIGEDPLSNRKYFSLAMRGSMTLKMLDGEVRFIAIITSSLVRFKGHRPSHCHRKAYLLTWGSSPINLMCMHSKLDLMCGGRGPFLAAVAMVVMVVDALACLSFWWSIES